MSGLVRRLGGVGDLALGACAALALVALVIAVESGVAGRVLDPTGARTVRAAFSDARQLQSGAPVRISGVDVGTVTSIALRRGHALVTMKLTAAAGPLYGDARAQIRYRTLLGGDFSVALGRGSASSGRLGSQTIPASRTGTQVELDDITSVVEGQARTGLQTMPGQLAEALADSRYPGATLHALSGASPSLQGGLRALRGERPGDVRNLIDSANATVRALAAPDGDLRRLVAGGAAFLQATAARQRDLQRTIAGAPGLLRRSDSTMQALDRTLRLADPLLDELEVSAPAVAPTARELRGTAQPADTLLHSALPLVRQLRPAVSSLAAASHSALPLLDQLTPSLTELADRILPYMSEIQPDTKHSMAEMIGPAMAGLGAMGAYEDNDGHFARFPATAGSESFLLPCQADFNPSQTQKLLACESLGQALGALFGGSVKDSSSPATGSGSGR